MLKVLGVYQPLFPAHPEFRNAIEQTIPDVVWNLHTTLNPTIGDIVLPTIVVVNLPCLHAIFRIQVDQIGKIELFPIQDDQITTSSKGVHAILLSAKTLGGCNGCGDDASVDQGGSEISLGRC